MHCLNPLTVVTTYLSRLVIIFCWSLCYFLLPVSDVLLAQGDPLVQGIDIQFIGPPPRISRERVLANLSMKKGLPYSWRLAKQDVRSLYATGLVSDVRISAEPLLNGVKVVVFIQGLPSIAAIHIKGTNQVPPARVRREISAKVDQALSEERLAEARRRIIRLYESKNFGQVRVSFSVQPTPKKNYVRVTFNIVEGPRIVVGKISFVGNSSLSSRELRTSLRTKSRNLLSFINGSGRLTPERLDEDKRRIRLLYQNRGFADAECIGVQVKLLPRKRVEVIYKVREGTQYHVRAIRFSGIPSNRSQKLLGLLRMREGALYTPKGLHGNLRAINGFYGKCGFLDHSVNPHVFPVGASRVDLLFDVDEGVRSYVNLIRIQGNTRTRDFVVRRELALKPGEIFDTQRMDISRARLQNLNYFSRVDLFPQSTLFPHRKDLHVLLEEKNTGNFNIGAGYSSIDSLVGFAELQQTNFDLFGWPTFYGAGQRLRIRMQYGLERKDFIVSLAEPWFLGRRLLVGIEGYYHDADYLSTVYDQMYYGGAFHFRLPITSFISMRGECRREGIYVHSVAKNTGLYIQNSKGRYTRNSLSAGLDYDTRDNLFLPRHGAIIRYTNFLSGGMLGGSVQDYGLSLDATRYVLLPRDLIFMAKARIAVTTSWGRMHRDVPIFDRLYLGGSGDLRGFDFRDVGPKDKFGNAVGGSSLFFGTLEVTFPVLPRIRGALFTDWGGVNVSNYDFSAKNTNGDIGVGLHLDFLAGTPVRFDFGYPIKCDKYNRNKGRFQFNIGYQF
ncbi:outer membrane protein assembly factor BamA [Candidatus Xiphinematobacter sp. Idaho Grape]|uniref:outer membrane protein assembly factor BamA n=1 Tax=Candidatus Xiphinematobacter sp. Idaho Grape TaxID=1704307 RepID=UPI00130DC225|nr:outer membrane protein assembly factor BamA [Candidatus Xiphinematobacter sp. Idaho Grape]